MSRNLRTILGIDEAGYGPRLGPLVVAVSAFRVPDDGRDLRALLPGTAKLRGPLPVDDSKKIYQGGRGLDRLERSVLAFRDLAARAGTPDEPRETPPWGLPWPPDLPTVATTEQAEESREALADMLRQSGVEALELRSRTVGPVEFNEGVARTDSKASVLFETAMELVAPWMDEAGPVDVLIDRHGGRSHYSALLMERFPDRYHWVLGESREESAYRFPREGGDVTVRFLVKGDARHLPIALASMAAKYVRELHMRAFNAHFAAGDPELEPTAGYPTDSDRWLADSRDVRERLGVDDADLIRLR